MSSGSGTGGIAQTGATGSGPAADIPYVPANPNVGPEGDGKLSGGSFEGYFGDGWDACGSYHPDPEYVKDASSASHGERFVIFDSNTPCPGCNQWTNDLQVVLGLNDAIPAEAQHLYFDVVNLGESAASGVLTVGAIYAATTNLCQSNAILASVPLQDLALSSKWQTRCVSFTPEQRVDALGLYVSDGSFRIGLDALRFGPPCRE